MPDGPLFSDDPVGAAAASCRTGDGDGGSGSGGGGSGGGGGGRAGGGGGAPKKWDVKCILKILCNKKDRWVMDQIATANVDTADDIWFDDPYFDGAKWTTKRFDAGGTVDSKTRTITILSGTSCETAATTFYHEAWHYAKQAKVKGWPHDQEDDAYINTELWTMRRKFPSQFDGDPARGLSPLRKKVGKKTVVDKTAVYDFVEEEYPGPPPPIAGVPQPVPIGHDPAKNETKVWDPVTGKESWRASKKGDRYDGPEQRTNPKTLNKKDFKCP